MRSNSTTQIVIASWAATGLCTNFRVIKGVGLCCTERFLFTVGLSVIVDEMTREGRFCFNSMSEAKESLQSWSGKTLPSGNWIKYKGRVEFRNPNYKENE